jgi:iron-sulfur cluster assembly accessory protein
MLASLQWRWAAPKIPTRIDQRIDPEPRRSYFHRMTDQTAIDLSAAAAARVAAIAAKQGKPAMLRLSVDGGGCAGFQYVFGLADAVAEDDVVTVRDGVSLVVDTVSLDLVRGAMVDYVESLGGAAFRVENPQAASGCGCGSSFSI